MLHLDRFLSTLEQCLPTGQWQKLTLSQPLPGAPEGLKSVALRPVIIPSGSRVQAVFRYPTSEEAKTLTHAEAKGWVAEHLGKTFAHADLYTPDAAYLLKYWPKQKTWHWKRKAATPETLAAAGPTAHNREKQRFLDPALPWLEDLGITQDGQVRATMQDKWRQMNKFLETIAALTAPAEDGSCLLPADAEVLDMGCGKAYLTFALHQYLTQTRQLSVTTIGVDRRPDLMASCQEIAVKNGLTGLSFATSDIASYEAPRCDLLIALHACDTATDLALAKALRWQTPLILVAPCCHKQVRRDLRPPPVLLPMLGHGILLERQAEMLTDTIRALLLESNGYRTKVFEFISPEHTPKNVMITAEKVRRPQNLNEKIRKEKLAEIHQLKEAFGLAQQELEGLLAPKA